MKTVGIIIQHYDARNDVRDLVGHLTNEARVILLGTRERLAEIGETPAEKRPFVRRIDFKTALWMRLFLIFGKIPESRDNFFITELFKLAGLSDFHRKVATLRLRLRMIAPRFIGYDTLLKQVEKADQTPIDDIDLFLGITEIADTLFLARAVQSGKPVNIYVYSWDHACKHTRFSQHVHRYLTWHEGIRDDLKNLQGIDASRSVSAGATQLYYIREYLESPEQRTPLRTGRYVYYGCGIGMAKMAEQEARLITAVARILMGIDPNLTFLVRPYPMLRDVSFFQDIEALPNVAFDDGYRKGKADRSLTHRDIYERLNLQEHAVLFLHCGTTMGLEGTYLDTPVIFLAPDDFDPGVPENDFLHIRKFIRQYHNDRYMRLLEFRNTIVQMAGIEPVLREALESPEAFLEYNRAIRDPLPLRPLDEIARAMLTTEPA